MHTHRHTHTHTYAHAHTHTRTRAHTHTHTVGQQGVNWLYGSEARLARLSQEIQDAGGIITADDLRAAKTLIEDVLRVQVCVYGFLHAHVYA